MVGAGRIIADPMAKWAGFRLVLALGRLRLALKAYDPEQPRAPGGTEKAGQWIAVDRPSDLIQLAGGFDGVPGDVRIQDFTARLCKGGINREFPGEYLNCAIKELMAANAAGDANAAKCWKLLGQDRFWK